MLSLPLAGPPDARRRLATGPSPNDSRTPRNPPVTARRLQRGLDEALARTRRRRTGRRHPRRRRLRRLRRGSHERGRRRRRLHDHAGLARRAPRSREAVVHGAEAQLPEGGHLRVPDAADPGGRLPRPARGVRERGREARHPGHGHADREEGRPGRKQYFGDNQAKFVQGLKDAGLHRGHAPRGASARSCSPRGSTTRSRPPRRSPTPTSRRTTRRTRRTTPSRSRAPSATSS